MAQVIPFKQQLFYKTTGAGVAKDLYTPEYQDQTAVELLKGVDKNIDEIKENLTTYFERTTKNISLSNIGVVGYILTEPLQVTIIAEDDVFVAVSYDLNTYGYGDTEAEAVRDLRESIVEYYEDLKEDQKNLGEIPKQDFEYLKRVLKKKISNLGIVKCS